MQLEDVEKEQGLNFGKLGARGSSACAQTREQMRFQVRFLSSDTLGLPFHIEDGA